MALPSFLLGPGVPLLLHAQHVSKGSKGPKTSGVTPGLLPAQATESSGVRSVGMVFCPLCSQGGAACVWSLRLRGPGWAGMEGGGTALPCPGAGSGSQRSLGDVFWYKMVSGGATWQSLNPARDFGQGRDVEPDRAQHIPGAGTSSTPGSTGGPLLFILLELEPSQGELPPHPARGAAGCSCHRRDRASPGGGFGERGRAAPGVPTPCVTPREDLLIVPSQDTG